MSNTRKDLIDTNDIGKYLSMLYRHNRVFIDQNHPYQHLGSGKHTFLFYLKEHNGASQEEISRALDIDKASTARAIQKLESNGFVRRESDVKDRRVNHVFLTEAGEQLATDLKIISNQWKSIILESISEEEISFLKVILEKMARNSIVYRHKKEGPYDE